MPQAKAFPFEASLKKLETLVETMEAGELSLEESLKAFQEGIALTRACQKALADAEQTVAQLVKTSHGVESQPFESSDDG
ncbi:MAG: exodeoxyribonuclease VII small subunit [Gammaproteobacteria bacterium]|jgi:exodeoxyribonuclease VII small subunit|nr:exodeoxyribonuclease VII small subunit [Gammaproteobacteria bacterium]MBT5464450.1 exodeoxyribonuclease VII small subunit [Gammaproteobacteria bacterium]